MKRIAAWMVLYSKKSHFNC